MFSVFSDFWGAISEAFIGVLVSVGVLGIADFTSTTPVLWMNPQSVEVVNENQVGEISEKTPEYIGTKIEEQSIATKSVGQDITPVSASSEVAIKVTPYEVTDIFAGKFVEKISDLPMNGEPAAQYKFRIASGILSGSERKGEAGGTVVVSVDSDYFSSHERFPRNLDPIQLSNGSGAFLAVHARHDPETSWYELQSFTFMIVD